MATITVENSLGVKIYYTPEENKVDFKQFKEAFLQNTFEKGLLFKTNKGFVIIGRDITLNSIIEITE